MELFKKKQAVNKAVDILTDALHDDEISSFIVLVKKGNSTVVSINGDLLSQAVSLMSARKKNSFRRIEMLADIMQNYMEADKAKEDDSKSDEDTPGDGEI